MHNLEKMGSETAINGFKNENDIADKFNNWENDIDAQKWLIIMEYRLEEIESVKATVISGYKSDVNVVLQIKFKEAIDIENIQVKLVSNLRGYNQIDKRWLKSYQEMWDIPDDIYVLFAYFTGELKPYKANTRDSRRMFINEFNEDEKQRLLDWIDKNKVLIIGDILRGRGEFAAEWVLVAQKINNNARWTLKNINEVIKYYFGNGAVEMSPRGSIKIGKITVQRKGGDAGRDTANMLQFKINPAELFDVK